MSSSDFQQIPNCATCSVDLEGIPPSQAIGVNYCYEAGNKTTQKRMYCSQSCLMSQGPLWRCIACQKKISEVQGLAKLLAVTDNTSGLVTILVTCSPPCYDRAEAKVSGK